MLFALGAAALAPGLARAAAHRVIE